MYHLRLVFDSLGVLASHMPTADFARTLPSVKHEFGLGGNELASTAPSESMKANFIGLLEDSLGRGPWADPVASQLARPLDAILAYLPPEGTRVCCSASITI